MKLFTRLKTMQMIVTTFISTLSALLNIGSLMLLFIFIYAIIGMNLFATVKENGVMTQHLNFRTVPNSFITLIRLSTGESWTDLMHALSQQYSAMFQCIDNPSYQDYVDNKSEPIGCGDKFQTYSFFYSYIIIVGTTFLNLFIAIILDGYLKTVDSENKVFNT
jgi:hypothetical protein